MLGLPPLRFNTISLQEPPKRQLLQYESGALQQLPRLSLCILQTPPQFVVYEATVDLQQPPHSAGAAAAAVVSWTKVSPAVNHSAGSPPSHNPETTAAPACLHLLHARATCSARCLHTTCSLCRLCSHLLLHLCIRLRLRLHTA